MVRRAALGQIAVQFGCRGFGCEGFGCDRKVGIHERNENKRDGTQK